MWKTYGLISQSAWAGWGLLCEGEVQFSYLTALVSEKAVCSAERLAEMQQPGWTVCCSAEKAARIKTLNTNSNRHSPASPCCWGRKQHCTTFLTKLLLQNIFSLSITYEYSKWMHNQAILPHGEKHRKRGWTPIGQKIKSNKHVWIKHLEW